jgi:hypothetical protein
MFYMPLSILLLEKTPGMQKKERHKKMTHLPWFLIS